MDVKAGPSKIMSPHNAAEVTETKMPKEVKQLKKIISVNKKTPNKEATGTAAKNANKTVKPIIIKMACGTTFEIKNKKQSTSAKSKTVKTADSKIPDAPSKPRKVTKPESQTSKNATTTKNQTSSKAADNKTTKKDADKQKKEKASTAKATSKDTEKEATKKPRTTTKTSNEKEPQPGGSTSKPKTTKALKSTEKPSAIPKLITKTTATTRSTTKASATPKTTTKTTATPGSTTKTTTTPKSATKTTATPKSTTKTTASARTTRSRKQEPTSEVNVSFHNEILEEMQNLRASMNRLSLEYREKSLDKPVRRRVHFKDFPAIEENEEHEIEESVPQNGTFTVFQNTAGNVKAEEDNAFLNLPSGSNIHDTTYDLNDAYESDDNDDGKLDGTYNIIDSADDEMDDENKKNDDQATTNDDNIEKLIDDKLINEKVDLYDNLEEKLKLEKSKKLKLLTVKPPRKYEDDLRNERKKLKKNKKERKICKALLEMSIYVAKHFDGDHLSSDESSDSSPCSCCSSYEDEETCSCSDCESSSTYYSSTETASTDDESSDNYCYKKKRQF